MGDAGSGKYSRHSARDTVESHRSIDVRKLKKGGWLEPGRVSSWTWCHWDGTPASSINIRAEVGRVVLEYRTQAWHETEWVDRNESVTLDWSSCHFGRDRPWFVCPGRDCGQRVAKLFSGRAGYLCRHCNNLTYNSTRANERSMAIGRASAIRIRLGSSGALTTQFPSKPKGMWAKTYLKLACEHDKNTSLGIDAMALQLENIDKTLNSISRQAPSYV